MGKNNKNKAPKPAVEGTPEVVDATTLLPPAPPTAAETSSLAKSLASTKIESTVCVADEGAANDDAEDDDESADESYGASDEEVDMMEGIPPSMVRRVDYLSEQHNTKKEEIMKAYSLERAILEAKFQEQLGVVYGERAKVINGDYDEKIDEEFVAAGGVIKPEEEVEKITGCPQFWLCALGQMETISQELAETDVDCLEYLKDIQSKDMPEGKGFTLSFVFQTNPYFENEILTKTYYVQNLYLDEEPILDKVEGCEIQWKAGKNLAYTEIQKKQRNKSGKKQGQVRTITKLEKNESFFHFFDSPVMPNEDMDEEEADALEEAFDKDYDIAQAFRSCIVPNAIQWFTGEAAGEEEYDSEDDDDEDDLESDEDDSEDDEEPAQKLSAKAKGKKNKGGVAGAPGASPFPPGVAGEQPNPECKQN